MDIETLTYEEAWQRAEDAWVAAGKTTPCYDPAYMQARKVLAEVIERVEKNRT